MQEHGAAAAPPHVFDQTNGVLGPDSGRPESDPPHETRPPRSFGVPPVVSL